MNWFAGWIFVPQDFVSTFRETAPGWFHSLWPFLWQSSLLICVVALLLRVCRSLSAEWRQRVWLVVAAKLLVLQCWYWTVPWRITERHEVSSPEIVRQLSTETESLGNSVEKNSSQLKPESLSDSDVQPQTEPVVLDLAEPIKPTQTPVAEQVGDQTGEAFPAVVEKVARVPVPSSSAKVLSEKRVTVEKEATEGTRPVVRGGVSQWRLRELGIAISKVDWASVALGVWCAGVVLSMVRWMAYWVRLRSVLRRGRAGSPGIVDDLSQLAREYSLRRSPRLVVTQECCSPFVCGGLFPTVVFPEEILEELNPEEIRSVFLHELAHVRRGDLWWNWLPELCVGLYWFHPGVYWLRRQSQLEAEMACDQLAMQTGAIPPGLYADTLIRVVARLSQNKPTIPMGVAAASALLGGE